MPRYIPFPAYHDMAPLDISYVFDQEKPAGKHGFARADGENVRFASEVQNNVEHTVIRELQYPLVRNVNLPTDHKLILSQNGGRLHENPRKIIMEKSNKVPYRTPAQIFRQYDCHYGASASMNCYILSGEKQGLYVGSHDELIQDTWHGLRGYADKSGKVTSTDARRLLQDLL